MPVSKTQASGFQPAGKSPHPARWSHLALLATAFLTGTNASHASLIAREGFDQAGGSALAGTTGPQGFVSAYTTAGTGLSVEAGGAGYGDLAASGNKLAFTAGNNGNFGILANSPETPGTSVYMSYLIKVDPTAEYAGVSLFDGNTEVLFTGKRTGTPYVLGLEPKVGTGQNTAAYSTRLSLVVCRIDFAADSAVVRMYVNPQTGAEPATADATVTRTSALVYDRVRFQSNATGFVDEFRMGDTFEDVVPMTYGGNPSEVVVLGSSVAAAVGASNQNEGWAYRMKSVLENPPPVVTDSRIIWNVHNASVSGNNTTAVLNRLQNDVITPRAGGDVVLIALSMANEGLVGSSNPQPVFDSFKSGVEELIRRCRLAGFHPVVSLCYPHNSYNAAQYAQIRKMNLLLNTWDTPCVNFLGSIDDGSGHWTAGFFADEGHPNSQGHLEMASSVVPSLFEAIVNGKTATPDWTGTPGYLRILQDTGAKAPLAYTPAQDYRSFTLAFRTRSTGVGTLACVATGAAGATLESRAGSLVYVSSTGAETVIPVTVNDGTWHDVALSHRKTTNTTLVFVDGQLKATVNGAIAAPSFVIGGPGAIPGRAEAPAQADYQDVAIYRAAWTEDEALAQANGRLQQASLDVLSTLDDAAPAQGATLANRAQSYSALTLQTPGFSTQVSSTSPDNLSATSYQTGRASLIWTDHTNGAAGYTIQRRRTDVSEGWQTVGTTTGNKPSFEDSGLLAASPYAYRVLITASGLQEDASNVTFVTPGGQNSLSYQSWVKGYYPPAVVENPVYQIDFNAFGTPDYGGQIWNTVTGSGVAAPLVLRDAANNLSTFKVAISDGFDQTRNDNGSPLAGYPAAAQTSQVALRDDNPLTGAVTFSGLDPAAKYDFTFFARRGSIVAGFDYNGNYTFTGGGSPVSVVVNANMNTMLTPVAGIAPDASGNITLTVAPVATSGSRFPCLNFIKFQKSTPGTHLIDFNTNANPAYGAVRWNTVNSTSSTAPYTLRDIYNTTSGVSLALTDGFDQFRTDPISPIPDLAAAAQNSQFCLRDDNPLTAAMTFTGLDPAKSYDFSFFSRRGSLVGGYDYTGTFTFTGAGAPVVVVTDAAVNTTLTTVPPVTPDATGKVTLGLSAGPGAGIDFPVLNLIRLAPTVPPVVDARTDPYADPDGDGLRNFEEYARGFNPTVADGTPFRLNSYQQDATDGGRFLIMLDRKATEAKCVLESSTDLTIWSPDATATRAAVGTNGSVGTFLYEVPPSGTRKFYRFRLDLGGQP
ncbi:hypothetical protein JIN84_21505 [Luteolibacter yonseiensis]|uniref:Fibronectin type-III domain-containing protein n=1 Tax=Luteolibacter yonseiensis TaxID=1144680 RepID=A0A934RAL7_9BACT|nr:GDSL-type esterase/lipase family protein [Luteolibacter yonseiensis]MBK1818215.1 hypothetical protein [Luteolibacter yonseiensis]